MKSYNLFALGLGVLSILKLSPDSPNFGIIKTFIIFTCTIVNTILLICKIYLSKDVDMINDVCHGFTISYEQLSKFIVIVIYKEKLRKVLSESEKFWDCNLYPKLITECNAIYKFTLYAMQIYKTVTVYTVILLIVQNCLKKNELLLHCWIPGIPYSYEILKIEQLILLPISATYILGVDMLFFAFCIHISVQIKLIGHVMKEFNLNDQTFKLKLKECATHRNFLLRYLDKVSEIFTIILLAQYIRTILLFCVELYIVTISAPKDTLISTMLTALTGLIQLCLYCLSASLINDQISNLSNCLYECKWYDGRVSEQRCVIIMLKATQQEYKIKASGLIEIGRESLLKVFKSSLSFYALMRQLKNK